MRSLVGLELVLTDLIHLKRKVVSKDDWAMTMVYAGHICISRNVQSTKMS